MDPTALEALAEYFKVFSEPNRLAVLDARPEPGAGVETPQTAHDRWSGEAQA
jgi:hypothetical protein